MIATLTAQRVVCSRAILAAALKDAARVLPGKALQPILTCVLLTCNGAVLRIGATDLSISLVRTMALDESQDLAFAVAVPGAEFATLIGNLGSVTVELSYDEERKTLQVLADGVRATFKTQAAEDYPKLPTLADATWEIPSLTLQQALTQTIFAAAEDDSRPALAGISLLVEGETVRTQGADGFRGAISRLGLLLPVATALEELVPATAARLLLSLLGKTDAQVGISKQGGELVLHLGDSLLGTRLIEGQFPDLARSIPATCTTTVVCSAIGLLAAVRQVEVLAEKVRDAKGKGPSTTSCQLTIAAGELTVSAAGSLGNGTSTMTASVEGPPLEIGVNSVYLREALEAIGAQPVEIGLNGNTQPLRLRRAGEKDFVQVIMPIYLPWAK